MRMWWQPRHNRLPNSRIYAWNGVEPSGYLYHKCTIKLNPKTVISHVRALSPPGAYYSPVYNAI